MSPSTILVADHERVARAALCERLREEGYLVREAATGRAAIDELHDIDVALIDHELRDIDGLALLQRIRTLDNDLPVIVLTGCSDVQTAVAAMKAGAFDCACKPLNLNDITASIERALETTHLRRDLRHLRADAAKPYGLHRLVGSSPAMTALRHAVARVARTRASTILLTGESGTGKDLSLIHI